MRTVCLIKQPQSSWPVRLQMRHIVKRMLGVFSCKIAISDCTKSVESCIMKARPQRTDPRIYGLHGPEQPGQPRKRGSQFVWPRDKPHNSIWGRWKDVLTFKGPDVWVTRRGSDGPHRPVWSGWRGPAWDNLGYKYVDEPDGPDQPLAFGRDPLKKFNFKTRRFERFHDGMWTDVKYCREHREPIYTRGVDPEDDWYNQHFEQIHGVNPFEYDFFVPWWNWDENPHKHAAGIH